jgi:hypothetical protein
MVTKQETSTANVEAIRQAALDYIEAWYEGDASRGEKCLHPDLAKRMARVDPETGKSALVPLSATKLKEAWASGNGTKTPEGKRLKEITILDVFGDMASVKLVAADWVDYMHLAKFNGEWVIVNVLWDLKPKEQ